VRDPWGEQILVSLSGYQAAQDGADLVLTLDRNIQHEAERILAAGIEAQKAASGSIVVLDPQTGGILAMAVYPSYKPGAYGEAESNENYVNTAVSAIYEPGSVFKPLTLAAALEAGTITPESSYDDRGEIIVGGQKIMNSDRQAHGTTTMTELLAYSRNVGAAYVATTLGPTRFYEIMRRFGFGEITGVDLALESPGIMRVPGNTYWHISDLGTNSYGQGISVTPLQVVAAYGALANDGLLMRPYIVAQMRNGDQIETRSPTPVRQVVRAEVARQVTEMMADAVDLGLPNAVVPGYRMAGKSGRPASPIRRATPIVRPSSPRSPALGRCPIRAL
jgi:cell division protein FtsI (penicillin-binding protein 3)